MRLQNDIAATVQYSRTLAQDPTQEKHYRGTMWHTDTAWSHTVPIAPLRFITGSSVLPTQWVTGTIDATEAHAAYFSRLDPRWRKEFLKDPLLPFRIFSILNYEDSDVLDHCVQQAVQTGTAEIVQFAPGELVLVSGFAVHAAMNHEQAAAAAVNEPRLTIEGYF